MPGSVRGAVLLLGLAALVSVNVAPAERRPSGAVVEPAAQDATETGAGAGPVEAAPGPTDHRSWPGIAARAMDSTTLPAHGVTVPPGANVFAARIADGGPSPAYMLYEAGGGAFSTELYPASSIKVLATVGALELAYSSGFSGAAVVDGAYTLSEYYDPAIRYSSNEDYDTLVRIAGLEWLNREFLPSRGYFATRIQEAYAGGDGVRRSPPVHLAEAGRELSLPERSGAEDYGCGAANCSTLFELVDSVRRIVLDDELEVEERFAIAPADVAGIQDALLGADSWIGPGVVEALGPGATIYSKPGWTTGSDCVDVGLVVQAETNDRYLIGVSAPDDGECAMLATMAAEVLTVLAHEGDGEALRTDGTLVPVVDGQQQAP